MCQTLGIEQLGEFVRVESWVYIVFMLAFFGLFWVLPAFLVAKAAKNKQRSFVGFLIVSLIIGWIIPLLVVLVMKQNPKSNSKQCPFCAELVHPEAKVCKHCNRELQPQTL